MKVTSFEISKKLAEIGFKDYSGQFYKTRNGNFLSNILVGHGQNDYSCDYLPAYDLETILDALPKTIKLNEEFEMRHDEVGYYWYEYEDRYGSIVSERLKDESLADTAARLLIKLIEEGLI